AGLAQLDGEIVAAGAAVAAGDADLAALQVGDRLDLAALDQVLAHHQRGRDPLRRLLRHRGDDLEVEAALDAVEGGDGEAGDGDVELARSRQSGRVLTGGDGLELDIDPLVAEVAFLDGEVERREEQRWGMRHSDRLGGSTCGRRGGGSR